MFRTNFIDDLLLSGLKILPRGSSVPLFLCTRRPCGYTYFWSGPAEGHTQSVAIAVVDQLLPVVDEIRCVSERLMSLRLKHSQSALTVVSVRIPANSRGKTKQDQEQKMQDKDTFYRHVSSNLL